MSEDNETKVDIVLFPGREEASAAHKRAVRRLLQIKFARDLSFMGRYLKVPGGVRGGLPSFRRPG